ncbi:MAG: hypothetical protein PHS37_06575, partial [Candidatus Omnitrophica bacterium]|nr:hypothetical protein [Candidatus Omnitrophota bacterium]
SPYDRTVIPAGIEAAFGKMRSRIKQIVRITDSENRQNHVLAGDLLAPHDTGRVADVILKFIVGLPGTSPDGHS